MVEYFIGFEMLLDGILGCIYVIHFCWGCCFVDVVYCRWDSGSRSRNLFFLW